tara:strand:+ start:215 stop:451 length:237 start_codon:yes stop_codon:yes gene_type:complete
VENFALVILLCGLCFYAGLRLGRFTIDIACEKVIEVLTDEKIIRQVVVNGKTRIYSGDIRPDLPNLPEEIERITKNKQ